MHFLALIDCRQPKLRMRNSSNRNKLCGRRVAWQPTAKLQCTPTIHCPLPVRCRLHAAPQQGQLAVAAWLFQMKFCGFSGLELCAVRSALRLLALNVAHFSHGARQTHNNKNNELLSLSLSFAGNLCPLCL